ncbi:hypothetical protein [Isoalcanivorax indicus]|uniref:hypothetical protein n=1 Tax=Isoalcanivorax indicus TaxID=2202653 RepID=UPI0013C4AA19|nr:hypothetical protein [Isoalcanivorax indicus]
MSNMAIGHAPFCRQTLSSEAGCNRKFGAVNRVLAIFVLPLLFFPCISRASWIEFCDFVGEIAQVVSLSEAGQYTLNLIIVEAAHSADRGEGGYTDCAAYVGESMQVVLKIPAPAGLPVAGDYVEFSRSAVEFFGPDGPVDLGVEVQFILLRAG